MRTYFSADDQWVQSLGDALVPYILKRLGFVCADHTIPDHEVINPGRCLLVIGSLLTSFELQRFDMPVDVWGCGWKGDEAWRWLETDARFHAVRGPQTATGLGLGADTPLGDPALLVPHLFPRSVPCHGKTLLIPHIHRIYSKRASWRAAEAGCDEQRTTLVFACPNWETLRRISLHKTLSMLGQWRRYMRVGVHPLWDTLDRIAGASFVLTGSLHGAIMAQAYGVPWASYSDGHVDAPCKWSDWGAYLGVEIAYVKNLQEGRQWWQDEGQYGKVRNLRPLIEAFPYGPISAQALPPAGIFS